MFRLSFIGWKILTIINEFSYYNQLQNEDFMIYIYIK